MTEEILVHLEIAGPAGRVRRPRRGLEDDAHRGEAGIATRGRIVESVVRMRHHEASAHHAAEVIPAAGPVLDDPAERVEEKQHDERDRDRADRGMDDPAADRLPGLPRVECRQLENIRLRRRLDGAHECSPYVATNAARARHTAVLIDPSLRPVIAATSTRLNPSI